MPTTLNPNSSPSVPASISVPDNGENANAASIRPAFQGLLDGVAALDGGWRIEYFSAFSSTITAGTPGGGGFAASDTLIRTVPTLPAECSYAVASRVVVTGVSSAAGNVKYAFRASLRDASDSPFALTTFTEDVYLDSAATRTTHMPVMLAGGGLDSGFDLVANLSSDGSLSAVSCAIEGFIFALREAP